VFVRTKRGADRLARNLTKQGFRAGALHGDMSQPQRERALARFAAGHHDVLVASDVAARGLDLDDISHVVNFDPPGDEKAYVHRVGRTACGARGRGHHVRDAAAAADVRDIAHRWTCTPSSRARDSRHRGRSRASNAPVPKRRRRTR